MPYTPQPDIQPSADSHRCGWKKTGYLRGRSMSYAWQTFVKPNGRKRSQDLLLNTAQAGHLCSSCLCRSCACQLGSRADPLSETVLSCCFNQTRQARIFEKRVLRTILRIVASPAGTKRWCFLRHWCIRRLAGLKEGISGSGYGLEAKTTLNLKTLSFRYCVWEGSRPS